MFDQLMEALNMVLQWQNFFWALFGVTFGIIMGAIPGLSDNMAIVLLLPFTYYLGPIPGIAMLMGLSKGANFGGSIPAILFNIPGTPQAMITTFDGYPLAKSGKSGKALKTALFASVTADTASDLVLIFLAAPVASVALRIGPPEYSMILLFSLVIISLAASGSPCRGLIATCLGLLLSTVGCDPEMGTPRFNFGFIELAEGIGIMPMAIGLLAFSEVLLQAESWYRDRRSGKKLEEVRLSTRGTDADRLTPAEMKQCLPTIARSTLIGSFVGIVPGIGTTVGAYLSYIWSKKKSKHPEMFGKGALEGIAASEAGNNAVNGPNLVPLVTLGIPGNLAAALILGGFMIKGLIPGPQFMESNAPLLYALFIVLLISNLYTFVVGGAFIRCARKLVSIPKPVLFSVVPMFCLIGSYVNNSSLFDIWLMLVFGVLGYALTKLRISLPTMIVAFFLGSLLEHKMRQSLLISRGDWTVFLDRHIACAFLLLTVAIILLYIVRHGFGQKKQA
ncbi:tripartite tricarboxylate transporter permease [uncultured Mailhella sp.]|uniref:tripartite tricarboxylate transporter permease n=1 Tax=uncultured Mailhella sp. TaxID=1981031 RepID=UPI0025E947B2|nr:tripartite tricarboxylate transporter permease [uncultured Mailhella sp.]